MPDFPTLAKTCRCGKPGTVVVTTKGRTRSYEHAMCKACAGQFHPALPGVTSPAAPTPPITRPDTPRAKKKHEQRAPKKTAQKKRTR